MGLILGGILAGAAIVGLALLIGTYLNMSEFGIMLVTGLALLLAIVMIFMGIFEPVNGYGEATEVSRIKLITLRDDTVSEGNGSLFYVSISGTNSYTYYTEIDSEFASGTNKAYKSNTISDSNVTIIFELSVFCDPLNLYLKLKDTGLIISNISKYPLFSSWFLNLINDGIVALTSLSLDDAPSTSIILAL